MSKYCTRCGAEVKGNFCENCGQPTKEEEKQGKVIIKGKNKKKHGCLTVIVCLFLFGGIMGALLPQEGEKKDKNIISNNKVEKVPAKTEFEQIGYAKFKLKSGFNNRSYVFFTNEKDKKKIIKHARSLPNTQGGFTYVHYYKDKSKAPDNTLFTEDIAFDLKGYTDGQILVYEKMASGKEVVWDGKMKDYKEIK